MARALIAFAVVFTAITANAEPPEGPARELTGRDLFGLQLATDPQIRPDGALVAYTRVSYDVMTDRPRPSIWLVDVATGVQTPLITGPRPMPLIVVAVQMPIAVRRCFSS